MQTIYSFSDIFGTLNAKFLRIIVSFFLDGLGMGLVLITQKVAVLTKVLFSAWGGVSWGPWREINLLVSSCLTGGRPGSELRHCGSLEAGG